VSLVVNNDYSDLQASLPYFISDHYEWLTCDIACGVYCQSDGGKKERPIRVPNVTVCEGD